MAIATIVITADRTASVLVTAARNSSLDTVVINRGAAGADGADGSNDAVDIGSFTAGESISSCRFVRVAADGLIYLADGPAGRPAHGYLRESVTIGSAITVYQSGLLNGLAGITPGADQWLGASGLRTETPPSTGISQKLGTGVASDAVAVEMKITTTIA